MTPATMPGMPSLFILAILLAGCSSPRAPAPPAYHEDVRQDGLTRGKAMGHNPVILYMTSQNTIGIAAGSEFSEGPDGWECRNNDLLINAGDRPVTVTGFVLARGESALVRDGKIARTNKKFGKISP
jgi:hypothetical protein